MSSCHVVTLYTCSVTRRLSISHWTSATSVASEKTLKKVCAENLARNVVSKTDEVGIFTSKVLAALLFGSGRSCSSSGGASHVRGWRQIFVEGVDGVDRGDMEFQADEKRQSVC